MNVIFHYPARCTSRPFDAEKLYTSPRGLTGSEEAFFRYAVELGRLGHDVQVYAAFENATQVTVGNVTYRPEHHARGGLGPFDACVMWMAPDFMKDYQAPPESMPFRLYVEQCSDHGNTPYPWELKIDVFGTLSSSHARHMARQNGVSSDRCRVVPNGVDLEVVYKAGSKEPGRCVWASSHDRGLHHLLGVWPEVRRHVPHATLRVLYNPEGMSRFAEMPEQQVDWAENLRRRSAYQLEALERLRPLGVELVGSVSRAQMLEEFARAEVLAYPCDPVRYTETFGSTVLEAMAAGCVPVLCLSDAFDELWGGCPAVSPPFVPRDYAALLAGVLSNEVLRGQAADECRAAARAYDWRVLGKRMDRCLETSGAEGFDRPAF